MITVVRTANIHDGKIDAAFAWAVKIAKYGRDKLGMNTQVARNIGGELYQLHWVSTYPSLADAEKATKHAEGDEGFKALVGEARQQGLLVGTSIKDSIYESVG